MSYSSTHPPSPELKSTDAHPPPAERKGRSPSASRLKESINGLVHRVKDVISPPFDHSSGHRGRSPDRKTFVTSTGRGGVGNMVSSQSRDRAMISDKEDQLRGEQILKKYADLPRSHGRGGAGNIRSPSRDFDQRVEEDRRLKQLDQEEKEITALYEDRSKFEPMHVGRGVALGM